MVIINRMCRMILLGMVAIACSSPMEGAKPVAPLETAPQLISEEAKEVVSGNSVFAFELYGKIKHQHGNLIFSPYSISSALAIAYAGANGQTQREMEKTLHFPNNSDTLQQAFALLNQVLTAEEAKAATATRLNIASSLWLQTGWKYLPNFQAMVSKQYPSALQQADFEKRPEEAREAINRWVLLATNGKIMDFLQPHDIEAMTRLILVNAIYMRGIWLHPFNVQETQSVTFHIDKESTSQIEMMDRIGNFGFLREKSYSVLELPYYKNSLGFPELAMIIVLPHEMEDLSSVEDQLNAGVLQDWINKMETKSVHVYLLKFKIIEALSLKDILVAMGMPEAFSDQADFSGITGSKDLNMSKVIHKSMVHVDENGTDAAAATAVSFNLTAFIPPEKPEIFKADHPFIFAIVDKTTQSILFLGRLARP